MKIVNSVFALIAASALVTSVALAGGDDCKKTCDKSKASCSSDTSVALSHCMPKMVMTVGEKTYQCPMEAAEAAKKGNAKVVYTVAGKKYECQEKAFTAYADVMDDFAVKFASVRTTEECKSSCSGSSCCSGEKSAACCSGSKAKSTGTSTEVAAHGQKAECTAAKGETKVAKTDDAKGECPFAAKAGKTTVAKADGKTPVMYCVAGQTFDCKVKAEQAAKTAQAAMKEVAMKYRVGDKEFCCDKMAGEACQKAGKDAKMVFVVGTVKTDCKIQARIELAKAKVAAAMKALDSNKPAEKVATKA